MIARKQKYVGIGVKGSEKNKYFHPLAHLCKSNGESIHLRDFLDTCNHHSVQASLLLLLE